MNRALKFTIWHGMAVSLALHSAVALPFVVNSLTPPPDDAEMLVVELEGEISDTQVEEKVAQAPPDQPQPQPTPPQEEPPPEPQEDEGSKPPEPQPQISAPQPPAPPQVHQVQDPDEQQKAQILKAERDLEADRLRKYVKRLTKKVQAHLVYPDEGRGAGLHGNARVSFTLAPSGQIKPGTLAIAESSGQSKLDASALATVRASAPFEPPPSEMNVAFVVGYGKKN
ncbi:protein TonB [Nitrobacter vulgaris]|uniref:energy transducer TonB n=1 Tax=Nitrobacter vulgaris TaxID=29421 RepID=UPI0028554A82|nr:TonB family protein [Nitrobacter vulgaris]MDR6305013.1 protein TonB [Nitrobacter vulgaris]